MGSARSMQVRITRKDQDVELPSNQRAVSKGTMQLLGHANHKPISNQSSRQLDLTISLSKPMRQDSGNHERAAVPPFERPFIGLKGAPLQIQPSRLSTRAQINNNKRKRFIKLCKTEEQEKTKRTVREQVDSSVFYLRIDLLFFCLHLHLHLSTSTSTNLKQFFSSLVVAGR